MAEDLVKEITSQLVSIWAQHAQDEFNLVLNVEEDIESLITTLRSIQAVLVDAEKREIELQSIEDWVQNLKFTSYDIDDALTDWTSALLIVNGNTSPSTLRMKVCLAVICPCFCSTGVASLSAIATKIRAINKRLLRINAEKEQFGFALTHSNPNPNDDQSAVVEVESGNTTPAFVDLSTICGRDDDKNTLLSKLLSGGDPSIIFILGMGGVGKSTLAQLMFKCDEVKELFEKKMWVCVGRTFDETRVAKDIVEEAQGSSPDCSQFQTALRHVTESVCGKKFLLVLDDVWTEDHNGWEPLMVALKGGAPGSKILITTRKEGVVKKIQALFSVPSRDNQMGSATFVHPLGQLSDVDCWDLFIRFAFAGRSKEFYQDFEVIGRKISDQCKGLPLAAKAVASLMLTKNTKEEWKHVSDNEIWKLEVHESLSRPLLLSYYDLPSPIKRCFCYCANFPKDSKIDADNLIQIWMAQGYLSSGGSDEMEITGRGYLNNLVMRSLFQDLERDKDNQRVLRFKLHDMVHDIARYLTKNECFMGTHNEVESKQDSRPWKHFRHLTITRKDDAGFPLPPNKSERLYTFWVQSFHDCPPIVSEVEVHHLGPKFFHHFKYLKALDLSRNMFSVLPNDVEKLVNLRYLNLSHNPLYELPETVCNLLNLQTLKLVACYHLTKLPQSIGKLRNLRHLEIDRTSSLQRLPRGIAMLTSLRTLSKFVIGNEDVSCKLSDLKHLNHLQGSLKIEGLGRVSEVHEAKEAELEKKENLMNLHMDCSSHGGANEVIEALQLNTNLRALQMNLYDGQQFPSWMITLTNLKNLRIEKWANCIRLPPLGKLPSLEMLNIEGLFSLTDIGDEFLGLETDKTGPSKSSSSSSSTTAFPKLKKLKFSHMENWTIWDMANHIQIMPRLYYLKVSHCGKLQSLPPLVLKLSSLKKLRIYSCVVLQKRYQKETGEDRELVSHISKKRIIGK